MPRLDPSLFHRAGRISPHLATLLPACRTIESARAELRWIREHVLNSPLPSPSPLFPASPRLRQSRPPPQGNGRRPTRTRRVVVVAARRDDGGIIAGEKARTATKPGAAKPVQLGLGRRGEERIAGRTDANADAEARVARLAARRGAGEPLQYVLGTQPFAGLEMLCERGVLIPRPETEAWASTLADLLFPSSSSALGLPIHNRRGTGLRILDLCSGTGCIGLSLYARGMEAAGRNRARDVDGTGARGHPRSRGPPASPPVRVFGFDVEPRAVRLARKNLRHNFYSASPSFSSSSLSSSLVPAVEDAAVTFRQADIFTDTWMAHLEEIETGTKPGNRGMIDVLVSNPPYISQRGFAVDTGRSVRNHEPKLALVPPPVEKLSTFSSSSSSLTGTGPGVRGMTDPPCAPEDIFYARLLDVADALRPRVAAFEVGDMAQAVRVVEMVIRSQPCGDGNLGRRGRDACSGLSWDVLEIWRDWPDSRPEEDEEDVVVVCGRRVPVRGSGHGRVVFLAEGEMVLRNGFANRGFRHEVYGR